MNVRAALYNGLYHPTAWSTLANGELFETFEQIQALNSSQLAGGGVQGSQKTNSASRRHSFLFKQLERSLLRRQDGNSTAISSNLMDAVTCGDSIDSTTTSKQVFDELLRVTQNVSGNCEYYLVVVFLRHTAYYYIHQLQLGLWVSLNPCISAIFGLYAP